MRIWVTRAQPGAAATAERLAALGHEPVVAPLLQVRELAPPVDLTGVAALAFTSANGVIAFARLDPTRSLPVYAVGDATAQAAHAAGFQTVTGASGDVAELAALILVQCPGPVLAPGAAERAGDLIGRLAEAGQAACALTVYETLPLAPPPGFDPEGFDAVLVHSPKAGRALAAYLAQRPAPQLEVFAISLAAAAPLAATPLTGLDAAATPTEGALLALL